MKLYYSPNSPYVRKVMAVAIATGAEQRITKVAPADAGAEFLVHNPLAKVPCLVTDDGVALFDSPVICEYLDAVGAGTLFPSGAARWRVLKLQAIGDGIMDAAVLRRGDMLRPEEDARTAFMARQQQAVARSLASLEADVPADHLDIGTITVACALGYLDFRYATEPWRAEHPKLAAWFEKMAARPEIGQTAPPG